MSTEREAGIGGQLFRRVLAEFPGKDITLDIYTHNTKAFAMYEKWGFEEDVEHGRFYRHWPEWPDNIKAECLYMRLKR